MKRGGDLYARWSKRERDLMIGYPSKPDGHLLYGAFCVERIGGDGKTLIQHLEERGYDITTLRFAIDRKPTP